MAALRKIVVVGDSHTYAIQVALQAGWTPPAGTEITARWFARPKNGKIIGDVAFDDVLAECAALGPDDLVVSSAGGNKHAMIGLVQHPVPFDLMDADGASAALAQGVTLIPRAVFRSYFDYEMHCNDCDRVAALDRAGPQRTLHLAPPPPKDDIAHILNRPEAHFAASGILERGVTPSALRLRIWELQVAVTRDILAADGIGLVPPPPGTRTDAGFLHPDFYAADATHANAAYGVRVLDQIAALADPGAAAPDAGSTVPSGQGRGTAG